MKMRPAVLELFHAFHRTSQSCYAHELIFFVGGETLESESESESESYVTTDGQPAILSWNKAPIWDLRPDLYYCLTVAGLLILGTLSHERTGLSFIIAAGPRQGSHFRVRVP
jgi:hypothetical protein